MNVSSRGKLFIEALSQRILLLDGSTGVEFQHLHLSENDVRGRRFLTHPHPLAANFDILNLTRPEVVEQVHRNYLDAGADIVETNTFNSNCLSQKEYGTESLIHEMNLSGARIASRITAEYTAANPDKPRFVAGSVGPTALSASLSIDVNDVARRAVDFDTLAVAYTEQCTGLIEGGVDFLLIETAFDLLNAKAAAEGARRAMENIGTSVPMVFSFTLSDSSGRILSGHTVEAIVTAMAPYNPAAVGFNCSAGPRDLARHARDLAAMSPFPVIFYPNAGFPDRMGNYDIDASEFAEEFRSLITDRCVNIIGGCCGSQAAHIAALHRVLAECGNIPHIPDATAKRPWLAGLEAFYDDRGFINVGERCNVAGSRKFLRLINEKKYDEALGIARKQVENGAMILDINMDDGLLDAVHEMSLFLRTLGSDPLTASLPWMIDSSKFEVIEEALKNIGGRAIVNSISLKHGEEEFLQQASVIKRYGAAVVVMLFDEKGQADTLERKKEIAARAIGLLTEKCGFERRDIVIDPNVLSIATGMPEHDGYALWFIEAVRWISKSFPGVKTSGGVSNLSFSFRGNNPLRQSMHAVFLYHAIRAGLSMAIVDPGTKVTYADIDPKLLEKIEDAILFRHPAACDDLAAVASEFTSAANSEAPGTESQKDALPVDCRLINALLKGDDSGLATDIPEAVEFAGNANAVVENILMEGMEEVGRLFEAGKMFLPQVVKSARTMHRAVAILEPFLEQNRVAGAKKGTFLVATVKGDVHDIGKNIAAVVLRCNNYDVIDLGVQVDAATIVKAVRENNPDFIALSGLISPSLEEMARILTVLHDEGISIPVLVGGAATSDVHTALRLVPAYDNGFVARVADASQDPLLASRLTRNYEETVARYRSRYAELAKDYNAGKKLAQSNPRMVIDWNTQPIDKPSFTGIRTLDAIPVKEIIPYINWIYFYACWKIKPDSAEAVQLRSEAEEVLNRFVDAGTSMRAQVAFYHAFSDGDEIHIGRITIPTHRHYPKDGSPSMALSDYIAPEGYGDHVGCFTVTIGEKLRNWSVKDDYERLLLQSLCDRLTEATSEWLHYQVRTSLWGYSPDEPLDIREIQHARYRGIRPAVGYPSLPDQMLMHQLMKLLDPDILEIQVTENGALSPSSTVAGFYLASPLAKYF